MRKIFRIKFHILIFLMIIFIYPSIVLLAQENNLNKSSLLWKISGNKIRKTSYIYGTIHMICQNDLIISEKISKAFNRSKILLLELNTSTTEMEMDMLQLSLMPDTLELKDLIREEDYRLISEFFTDTLGIPFTFLSRLKPMITTSMLTESLMDCPLASYEITLTSMAEESKKNIVGLETIEDQFKVIDMISLEEQAQELYEAVLDYTLVKSEIAELITAYKNEDLDLIYQLVKDQFAEMDDYEDLFLVKRNNAWIDDIEKYIRKKPSFIAVGAAHLIGKKGLINLLKEKGYKVEPVF